MEDEILNLKDPSIYSSWTKSTVRYSDLDPNGHVNNGAINADPVQGTEFNHTTCFDRQRGAVADMNIRFQHMRAIF